MTTIEEVNAQIDQKLDEVRNFVTSLQAGSVVTQEQLDALAAALDSVRATAQSVLAEADTVDGTP